MLLRNNNLVNLGKSGNVVMPPQHRATFEEGCAIIFSRWTALQLGIENEWGGPDSRKKAQQALEEVISWFYTAKDQDMNDLEDFLDEVLQMDFNIQAEDGSPYQVARSLMNMHTQVAAGDYSYVQHLRSIPSPSTAACQRVSNAEPAADDESSSSDEEGEEGGEAMDAEGGEEMEMDEPPPQEPQQPLVDDDGFQMVRRKGRGQR